MRTTRVVTVTEDRTVVDDILCNRCARSCRRKDLEHAGDPERRIFYAFKGAYRGGYGSEPLDDMAEYHWHLCEVCLKQMFDTFRIPVEEKGYSVMDELYGVGPE
jgi:hypothetical protein